MIGDRAKDREATVRANREGHGSLVRRRAHCRRNAKEAQESLARGSGLFLCWRAHVHSLSVGSFPMPVSIAPSFLYIPAYCLA